MSAGVAYAGSGRCVCDSQGASVDGVEFAAVAYAGRVAAKGA